MKIGFLGDSITEGACATSSDKVYHQVAARIINAETYVDGKGGSHIAKQINIKKEWDKFDFVSRVDNVPTDCDLVVVFGGTNDYGHGDAPIGNKESIDPYTFYGAMNVLVSKLLARFKKEQIIFLLPLPRYGEDDIHGEFGNSKENGNPLVDYVNVIKNVLDFNNIYYVDLFNNPVYERPITNQKTTYSQDGLHPTDEGHRLLGEFVAKIIEERIL